MQKKNLSKSGRCWKIYLRVKCHRSENKAENFQNRYFFPNSSIFILEDLHCVKFFYKTNIFSNHLAIVPEITLNNYIRENQSARDRYFSHIFTHLWLLSTADVTELVAILDTIEIGDGFRVDSPKELSSDITGAKVSRLGTLTGLIAAVRTSVVETSMATILGLGSDRLPNCLGRGDSSVVALSVEVFRITLIMSS